MKCIPTKETKVPINPKVPFSIVIDLCHKQWIIKVMARPIKTRMVSSTPVEKVFYCPNNHSNETIHLTVEEYEIFRLLDLQGYSQEEVATLIGVGRTTITSIYATVRKKIAIFLTSANQMEVGGGCYAVKKDTLSGIKDVLESGNATRSHSMKVAATYENGNIFPHFGRTEQMKIYTIEDGKPLTADIISTEGVSHGALINWLKEHGVEVLLCGGIGGGAVSFIQEAGITLFAGLSGPADDALEAFLENRLSQNSSPNCDHHGEGECHCHDHK